MQSKENNNEKKSNYFSKYYSTGIIVMGMKIIIYWYRNQNKTIGEISSLIPFFLFSTTLLFEIGGKLMSYFVQALKDWDEYKISSEERKIRLEEAKSRYKEAKQIIESEKKLETMKNQNKPS